MVTLAEAVARSGQCGKLASIVVIAFEVAVAGTAGDHVGDEMVVVVAVADAAAEVGVGRADGCATTVSGVVTEVVVAVGVCCDCRSCIGEVVAILRQVLQDAKIRRIVGNQPLLCHIRHAGNGRHRVNVGQVKPVDALGWQLRQVGGHHTVRDFSTFTINGLEDVIFSAAAATAAREGDATDAAR